MKVDEFGRPCCPGWGPTPRSRCERPVHPGYSRCPWCDRVYSRELLDAALAHPQNASFRPAGWVPGEGRDAELWA
jgi:hypothetical protein